MKRCYRMFMTVDYSNCKEELGSFAQVCERLPASSFDFQGVVETLHQGRASVHRPTT